MRQQQELLRGTVNAVVFYNAENGYCVLRLQCDPECTTTPMSLHLAQEW